MSKLNSISQCVLVLILFCLFTTGCNSDTEGSAPLPLSSSELFFAHPDAASWQRLVEDGKAGVKDSFAIIASHIANYDAARLQRDLPNSMTRDGKVDEYLQQQADIMKKEFAALSQLPNADVWKLLTVLCNQGFDEDLIWTTPEIAYRFSPTRLAEIEKTALRVTARSFTRYWSVLLRAVGMLDTGRIKTNPPADGPVHAEDRRDRRAAVHYLRDIMRRSILGYLIICALVCCSSAVGTQSQSSPRLTARTQTALENRQAGQAVLADYMRQLKEEPTWTDMRAVHRLDMAGWALGSCCGYDFKADTDGCEYWYQWLTRRDESVIPKCLNSFNPLTIELGIDIAFSTGKRENVQLVLDQFQHDQVHKEVFVYEIACWARGEGLVKQATPNDIVGYDKVLIPTDSFWAAVSERVPPILNH